MVKSNRIEKQRGFACIIFILATVAFCGCNGGIEKPWTLTATLVAGGFTSPTSLAVPPDGSGRLFVTEQTGAVKIIDPSGAVLSEPFIDISGSLAQLAQSYDESGLLGMAFDPAFNQNGRFYLFYTAPPGSETPDGYHSTIRISEFTVAAGSQDRADGSSEIVLLEVPNPQSNHNGGQLAFGPDGYLYIGIGDGGNANDVGPGHTETIGNAQDLTNLLGKILRLDVSEPGKAVTPETNPFASDPSARPEIYAYGLRNPWRFSFDRGGTNQLFCGDVGQNLFEEISIVTPGGNYGWNIREGFSCFNPENATDPPDTCESTGYLGEPLIDPILAYPHPNGDAEIAGRSVTGGYVYRGTALPQLSESYVFGDWATSFSQPSGFVLVAEQTADETWSVATASLHDTLGRDLRLFLLSFGEDESGEIYLLTSRSLGPSGPAGEVYKITGALKNNP